jgi:hypothetical protein
LQYCVHKVMELAQNTLKVENLQVENMKEALQ